MTAVTIEGKPVDLATLPAETLDHLAHLARERERRQYEERERRIARASELIDNARTIGYYQRRLRRSVETAGE